jgi:predicted dienelactone hydrolase
MAAVLDAEKRAEFPLLMTYPSSAPERTERVGGYHVSLALDGALAEGLFPLVVVSHGSGGSSLTHRYLATYLARHGFVVALPEHPGNNRSDNALAGTHTLLEDRPRQVRQVIDWVHSDATLGGYLVPERVAVLGHSLGGYTALAVTGGRPYAAPHETPDRLPRAVPVTPDPRVRALVLLAPATPWFMAPGALQDVHVPVLIVSGEKDGMAPAWHAEVVQRGVPETTEVEHRMIANAGHYSFLSPFPPERTHPGFPPSQDPPGFDRAHFHAELYLLICSFLGRVL